MSVKKKKAGLVISWQKSFSILAPWKKGKGDSNALLDGEVVLTKMKLFSNVHERLKIDSTVSSSKQNILDHTKVSTVNSHLHNKSGQPQVESSSDYLSSIFSASQLQRLYKFESEDSGVELPSGANSPSTPPGSEQSFVVHSRESSCDSCNSNTDSTALPVKLVRQSQSTEIKQAEDSVDNCLSTTADTQGTMFIHTEHHSSIDMRTEEHIRRGEASQSSPEGNEEMSEQLRTSSITERSCSMDLKTTGQPSAGTCDDTLVTDFEPVPIRRSTTSDSLEEYMDECCKLSEAQQASSSHLGSGRSYLEHICQLIEKIGQLQETNLRLQRQICSLQNDSRMTKTKEDFFHQHCNCGAASLAFQDIHNIHSRSELSTSATLSDLSTIPEATQHPFISIRREMRGEGVRLVPLWRRGLKRRSYTEGEVYFLRDSTEGLSFPQGRLSENCTWGRVKALVRKTKVKDQSKLGLTSSKLKMSCPQLYRGCTVLESEGRWKTPDQFLATQSGLRYAWRNGRIALKF
ncbi:uncharacterized protein LOC113131704 isoform X2 [Mastacembelus armatus]|uniref:uncharacterized protein LOC113131704 isoform X2 n=1 Tax=Mastacembelus armatus TaxID=205130 RepID=UPI000E4642D9|nr:uncharacterized protein LOC113131704 isoform X2 [Mastacembelus armatus]